MRNEKEIWTYINKKRGKRERISNNIGKEEWEKYFLRLLERKK